MAAAEPPTTPYRSEWELDVDGDWVVWIDQTRPGGDLFAYNLAARSGFWVTDDDVQQHNPRVRGRIVAWEEHRQGQPDIFYYDLEGGAAPVRVTNHSAVQRMPVVGDRWIAYEDRSDFANGTDLWIHHLVDGVTRPLVQRPGDQTLAAFAADHVVFRDELYGQSDLMAVRIANGSVPFYLTRDTLLETAPVSDGNIAFFLRADEGSWRLNVFDGLRNRTRDTGVELDVSARMDIERGLLTYSTYKSGGNSYLSLAHLGTGRYARVTDDMPIRGPALLADGRVLTLLQPRGEASRLLVIEPSPYAVATPPRMSIVGPPDGAPFTGPRFTANGTFQTSSAWGMPLRFEYRFAPGEWTAFDAVEGEWQVAVELPRAFRPNEEVRFEVRAVFADAPSVTDRATIRYTRLVFTEPIRELPQESLWEKVERVLGAIVLSLVALVFVALLAVRLVLRGTLKRFFVRRVQAEYVRPDDPAPLERS